MDVGEITMEHDIDMLRMNTAMFEADDIGAIIRCHFEAEQAIDYVLKKLTKDRYNPKNWRWDFAQKVEILRLLGIPNVWIAPLKTLNNHRNSFAHKGQDSFEDQEIRRSSTYTIKCANFSPNWTIHSELSSKANIALTKNSATAATEKNLSC